MWHEFSIIGNIIGFAAGTTILVSGFPALLQQLKSAHAGTQGERKSRFLMGIGNGLWVVSAAMTGAWSLMGMALINTVIQLAIWRRMNSKYNERSSKPTAL